MQASAFAVFWATRTQLWQLFLVMAIAGLGVGAAFAALPAQLFSAVPVSETGSAMSLNQVLRYIGFALGSALTATILSMATPAHATAPGSSGYATIAVVGLVVCLRHRGAHLAAAARTADARREDQSQPRRRSATHSPPPSTTMTSVLTTKPQCWLKPG